MLASDSMTALSDPNDWVERHGSLLFSFALTRVRDRATAEDLVQETLLAALRSRDNFQGRSSESTWMVGILKNKIMDHFRKASREVDHPLPFENEQLYETTGEWAGHWKEGLTPIHVSPESETETRELRAKLDSCIQELPERIASIFTLRELDHAKTEDLCKEFSISPTNLGVILYRARAQLRRCLEKYWMSTQ